MTGYSETIHSDELRLPVELQPPDSPEKSPSGNFVAGWRRPPPFVCDLQKGEVRAGSKEQVSGFRCRVSGEEEQVSGFRGAERDSSLP